jgi:glutamate racemase
MNKNKIGIFDSGVGGLTVYREIAAIYPNVEIVYFGDTARVPYGSKSRQTIIEYSIQNTQFLLSQGVSIIIVACNTASAFALDTLSNMFAVPILGVINAGATAAVNATKTGKIGVIGTDGTINSHAYRDAIKSINSDLFIVEKSCPLFVPLVEEGWQDTSVARQVAEIYLSDILAQGIDTLVLGCTHYPILKKTLSSVCGENVTLVDSAESIARSLSGIVSTEQQNPINQFYVSDIEGKFRQIAQNILGVSEIDLRLKSW